MLSQGSSDSHVRAGDFPDAVRVDRLGKCRHKLPAYRIAAEFGEIDNRGQRLPGNQLPERRSPISGDRHVRMTSSEYDDRIAALACRAGAQFPPDAEGIDNRDPGSGIKQPLDEAFGRVGLARTGGTDNGDAVVKRRRRQHGWSH